MELELAWQEITYRLHLNNQDRKKYKLNSPYYIIKVNGINELYIGQIYGLGVSPIKSRKEREKVLELFNQLTDNKYKMEGDYDT